MLGEMCPQGAAGRPSVTPLVMRTAAWIDNAPELANVVERGSVPRFVVFGVDGKPAGMFDTMGLSDLGLGQQIASGSYTGAGPCTSDAGGGQRSEEPKCGPAAGGCGLAIAEVSRPDEPPEVPKFQTGGACLSSDQLVVDVDGDGTPEAFPITSVLDGVRSPSQEWSASATAPAACKPTFQVYDMTLQPPPEPNKKLDPKQIVRFHVLGVVDVDGDGRREVVLAFEFPTIRTIVVYTSTGSPKRLELAGEGQSFPR
jgi:hypothetical protein